MKLPFRQLSRHLERELAGVYLVAGEEPLLVAEALERVREAARIRGFEDRDLHIVERGFRWAELESSADNLSLFCARRIVELRLPSPRPGDAGARAIRSLTERPDPDRLVIVAVSGKLDSAATRSAWVKSIDQHGVLVDVWPVDRRELPSWIRERATRLRLQLTSDAAELLADRVEGNLLAADQELRKLALTSPDRKIDEHAVLDAVANSARFDVFRLTDAVTSGDIPRAITVLDGLRAEGVAPVLVCWALSREIGLLARLTYSVQQGESIDSALSRHRVWRRRQPGIKRALKRLDRRRLKDLLAQAARADSTIKGVEPGHPWEALTGLVVAALDSDSTARPAGR